MCGIFGYLGVQEAFTMALRGIKKLDYRGYDSAGVAGFVDGKLCYEKKSGRVAVLEQIVEEKQWQAHVAIGQTRWATHGDPSDLNAHPHVDLQKKMCDCP